MESQVHRIVDKIISDAKEKAKSIIEEAHKSSEVMLEQQRELARQKASEEVSLILKKAEEEAKVTTITEVAEVNRKASWMILREKERLINNVLDEVRTRLNAFSKSKKYVLFLQRLIVDSGTVLGGGMLEVLLNEKDFTLRLNFDELEKTITERTGVKTQLRLSEEKINAPEGTVIRRVDGRILVDNTFEAILKRREKHLRLKIAKILFE